ncbi:unnamed protein product [Ectocarpus sp. CCAP 1310/34]|nr:unnamed protein product [Ectocarpus sp. CCAP 1310/34]
MLPGLEHRSAPSTRGNEASGGGRYAEEIGDRNSNNTSSGSSSDGGLDVAWFAASLRPFDPGKQLRARVAGGVLGVETPFDRGKALGRRRPGRMRSRVEQRRRIWWPRELGAKACWRKTPRLDRGATRGTFEFFLF